MSGNEFNEELWEERHETNASEHKRMFTRLEKVEGRFLAIMVSMMLILVTAVVNLLILVAKLGAV